MEDTKDELTEVRSQLTYLAADFDNYKKRIAREKADIINNANKDIIFDLLSIVDDMEKIVGSIERRELEGETSPTESGFAMIYENLIKLLKNEGCERIHTSYGDKFDVNLHEAISSRKCYEEEGYGEDEICEIYQNGWMLNGKLLRASKVSVIKN